MKCLFKSFAIFCWFICFLIVEIWVVFIFSESSPLSKICFPKIFSQSVASLFIPYLEGIQNNRSFILRWSLICQFVFFFYCGFGVFSRKYSLTQGHIFPSMLSSRSYSFRFNIKVYDPFGVSFSIWYMVFIQEDIYIHIYTLYIYISSIILAPFIEKAILSPLHCLFTDIKKIIVHVCVGLFQNSVLCSFDVIAYPHATTTLFWLL